MSLTNTESDTNPNNKSDDETSRLVYYDYDVLLILTFCHRACTVRRKMPSETNVATKASSRIRWDG